MACVYTEPLGSATSFQLEAQKRTVEISKKEDDTTLMDGVDSAMEYYRTRFGHQSDTNDCFSHQALPWCVSDDNKGVQECLQSEDALCCRLEEDLVTGGLPKAQKTHAETFTYVDGEEITLCRQCNLPLGELIFAASPSNHSDLRHGECMGEVIAHKSRKKEEIRRRKDREEKDALRKKHRIGWKIEHIPRTDVAASKLAMQEVPLGMVCLVFHEDAQTIQVAATAEPAAAINLEYLSLALQVRRREGHEPMFSLDPVDHEDTALQEKVFEPEWLAGTVAGEVLFQADYHLKELSMGEYVQPVLGMKSCQEYAGSNREFDTWKAREWFIVRKAEIHMTEGSILIPFLKMVLRPGNRYWSGRSWRIRH
jgi:hypothetical protein